MSTSVESHEDRIARMRGAYDEAHGRFVARLRGVPADRAESKPADGGWSAAQIGWHVAAVDVAFADLLSGVRAAKPLADDFRERPWSEIASEFPARLEASGRVVPPEGITRDEALEQLERSARKIHEALQRLTPDRGSTLGITHRAVGTITLYQVGDWAVAHTIRHNAQAKRVLGV